MKRKVMGLCLAAVIVLAATLAYSAYHHMGEMDSDIFLQVYPEKTATKLDQCALCHTGGEYVNSKGKTVYVGSCQWCHEVYGYDGDGPIADTLNPFGTAYKNAGRSVAGIQTMAQADPSLDSDGDGYSDMDEINANTYPGNAADYPGLPTAPYRIYTRAELEALPAHTQFMLMNTARGGTSGLDSYDKYTGVAVETLLADAGILPGSTSITAYSPDGYSQTYPLEPKAAEVQGDKKTFFYHINGIYPAAGFYYDGQADAAENQDSGWVDYSAPDCQGYSNGTPITIQGGLRALLAYRHNGTNLYPGVLDESNKLQGEGPYRLVVPQTEPGPPDQPSGNTVESLPWPYDDFLDHNAGASARTVTMIKVEPLPKGTTDINVYEAGWQFVDEDKVIVYGNIDPGENTGPAATNDTPAAGADSSTGCFIGTLSK